MPEETKNSVSLIDIPELPASIDGAVKNLTDEPTKNIGKTFGDIWFLVFGGISQAADKRRMLYTHNLEEYGRKLEEAVDQIPSNKRVEPDFQTTAQALENSKYCITSEELQNLFVNLISRSMHDDYQNSIHPSFAEIIKQMSPTDARVLKTLPSGTGFPVVDYIVKDKQTKQYRTFMTQLHLTGLPGLSLSNECSSLSSLIRLGIVEVIPDAYLTNDSEYAPYRNTTYFKILEQDVALKNPEKSAEIQKHLGRLTPLGKDFVRVCVQ